MSSFPGIFPFVTSSFALYLPEYQFFNSRVFFEPGYSDRLAAGRAQGQLAE